MSFIRRDSRSRKAVVKIHGLRRLTKDAVEYAAYTSGVGLVKTTSADIIRKPKGGRVYIRRDAAGRKRRHVASAPGETHANMTGALRRSLGFNVRGTELEFGYGVFRNDAPDYARAVEFGTKRMSPRPSLQNNIKAGRRNIMNNLEREMKRRLK